MPVTYELDRERRLIHTRCVGAVLLSEVLQHFADLRDDASLPTQLSVLLDLSEMSTAPDRERLRAVVNEVKSIGPERRWGALAIVARTDLLFGMSRIFGIFVEDSFTSTGVFRRREEAEAWLASQLGTR
jgi:hypothetical protein